jgi:hypothetical protein
MLLRIIHINRSTELISLADKHTELQLDIESGTGLEHGLFGLRVREDLAPGAVERCS